MIKSFIYMSLIGCLGFFLVTSCSDNDGELEPSGVKDTFTLPQGDHDFDATIVDFYKRYATYILYKFTDKDAYWSPSGWKNGVEGSEVDGGTSGYIVKPADERYINRQLELIREQWLTPYSEKFLKAFLPVKILLCSQVDSLKAEYIFTPTFSIKYVPQSVGAWYNYYNICVNYGNSSIETMTTTDRKSFKSKITRIFIQSISDRDMVTPTSDFAEITDYNNLSQDKTNTSLWAKGTFLYSDFSNQTAAKDWYIFMRMMMLHSEEFLTRTPATAANDYDTSEAAWDGILNPAKDTNGLLKKKYDIVRNYFKDNYDMDLQYIGNHLNDN